MARYMNHAATLSQLGLLLSMGVGLLGVGCIPPSPMPRAAVALGCSQDQVKNVNIQGGVLVSGCGKMDVLTYDEAKDTWASLRERAAFEMSCGADEVVVTELGADTFGVTGCGRKAVYKSVIYVGLVAQSGSAQGTSSSAAKTKARAKHGP